MPHNALKTLQKPTTLFFKDDLLSLAQNQTNGINPPNIGRETILIKKSNGELMPATWTASRSPRGLNSRNLPLMEVRAFLLYPPRIAGQDPPYASDQELLAKCGCNQLGLNSHFFSTANPSTDPTKVNITYTLRMELRCIEVQQNLQHQSTGIEGKHQKR